MTAVHRSMATVMVALLLLAACSSTTSGTAAQPTAAVGSSAARTATATVTTTVTAPAVPPTDLAGEVYGFVTAVDLAKSQITLDKVDWFTGAAAQQACAEDGVTSTDNNWCTGYYYRNVNPALRIVAVSPQATISTLDGSRSVPSDLGTVAARVGVSRDRIVDLSPDGHRRRRHRPPGDVPPLTPGRSGSTPHSPSRPAPARAGTALRSPWSCPARRCGCRTRRRRTSPKPPRLLGLSSPMRSAPGAACPRSPANPQHPQLSGTVTDSATASATAAQRVVHAHPGGRAGRVQRHRRDLAGQR